MARYADITLESKTPLHVNEVYGSIESFQRLVIQAAGEGVTFRTDGGEPTPVMDNDPEDPQPTGEYEGKGFVMMEGERVFLSESEARALVLFSEAETPPAVVAVWS